MAHKSQRAQTRAYEGSSTAPAPPAVPLTWLRARYHFHTFCYRDPRSAFSSALGIPVVSPTAVLLGIASSLFNIGEASQAREFISNAHLCRVAVDAPDGAIFFRAFHQLRRYISPTKGKTHRAGFTDINQGTKEYALIDGTITIFVGVPRELVDSARLALRNRDHLGTHDSLCALIGEVEECEEPTDVVYLPAERWQSQLPSDTRVMIVTLSRFTDTELKPTVGNHWWMAGGPETELVPYVIRGRFSGTSKGKVYRKLSSA